MASVFLIKVSVNYGGDVGKETVLCLTLQWTTGLLAGTPETLCEASRYGNTV